VAAVWIEIMTPRSKMACLLTVIALALLSETANAKDNKVRYESYINGVVVVEYDGRMFTGTCRGTTIGIADATPRTVEGCADALGFAGKSYPVCGKEHGLATCMGVTEEKIGLMAFPLSREFVVVEFKVVSVSKK
jgi:hypothetical protein